MAKAPVEFKTQYQAAAHYARSLTRGYLKWGPLKRSIDRWRNGDDSIANPADRVRAFYRHHVHKYIKADNSVLERYM